ncbi:MAG: homoserine dehydrogenase [Candidatus Eisenbacteria bacterium]|uniref:Homoserine dehydrogenase n=1 Tax=Eiseniibacteriota bacterium TaxID=2212470 RepID=A0A538T3R4_UNCEI|nr:MAG: homoserine dehydrogenase [Candidatus Eisenbacteria bacterium]
MPPSVVRIGLLGCGVVGQGFLTLLHQRERLVRDSVGATLRVTRVAVRDPGKRRECDLSGAHVGTDPLAVANAEDVDLLIELVGGEAMLGPVRAALKRGIPVVTANKHLLALHGEELERLAADSKATIRYEASAGGGIPVLQALEHGLRTEHFRLLVAILNGTTNFILSTMERDGRDFAEALAAAQTLGFAEADPTLDLSGADTAQKLAILVRRAFRMDVAHGSIPTEGIIGMELEDLRQADRFGYTVKLLGIALRDSEGLDLRVHPAFIPKRYLLADVRDEFNGIYLQGEATGSMLFYGKGAGALPTAQAVLGDVLVAAREFVAGVRFLAGAAKPEPGERVPLDAVRTKYYLRLIVEDRPGVLAQVAACLGGSNVSVAQMFQAEGFRGEASITMLTHEAGDRDVREAVRGIANLPSMRKTPRAVRIFDL